MMNGGWTPVPSSGSATVANTTPYPYPPSNSTSTAFIPVQVRQRFGHIIPSPPAPAQFAGYVPPPIPQPPAVPSAASASPEPRPTKVEWPDAVRNYVQRSFLPSNLDPTVPRAEMEAKLKQVISHARDSGSMHSVDWSTMPLPQVLVREERERELRHASPISVSPPSGAVAGATYGRLSSAAASKKRKSWEQAGGSDDHPAPPWSTNKRPPFQDRVSHPSSDGRDEMPAKSSKSQKQLEKRQRRFDGGYKSAYRSPSPQPCSGPVVGTSQTLEKKYLRLTAPPVPSQVRPEHILRQTLDLLKRKWKKEANYSYICDQFKSMRQDLTVQRIKNDFTVSVYEIHARIALEMGDPGEYNQCQTQLRSLYALGLKGNPVEFKAYRILYFIHTANRTGLNEALADLTPAEKEERAIKHALNVRSSLALGNYHRFFQLYLDTPNMGAYLMDMFVKRERLAALCNICKAYKPDLRLRFITEELGFESDADAAQFIIDHNGQHLLEDRSEIMFLSGKAGATFESSRAEAFRMVDIKGQI